MEYIYALTGAGKVAIYDDGNNIMAVFFGKLRNVQWSVIEKDYRSDLVSRELGSSIYIAYISVANEIVLKTVGEKTHLVLLADPNNAMNFRQVKLAAIDDEPVVFYITANAKTGEDELWCIMAQGSKRSRKLMSGKDGIHDYSIKEADGRLYISYCSVEEGIKMKYVIDEAEFNVNKFEEYEIYKKSDIERLAGIYKENNETNERKLREQYEKKYEELKKKSKERLAEQERQYKNQYDELVDLTRQVQTEGRKWRDLYYKSIKK